MGLRHILIVGAVVLAACSAARSTGDASDLDPPETTITDGPSGTVSNPTAPMTFECDEAGCSFECALDGGAWQPCVTPWKESYDLGARLFAVRATDKAGNRDETPAERAFVVTLPVGIDVVVGVDRGRSGAAGALVSEGQVFSGVVWWPLESQASIEPHLLAEGHGLGALRFSLERFASDVGVSRINYTSTLAGALARIPELDFLARYRARGGELIWNLLGVPSWLGDPSVAAPSVCDPAQVWFRPPADPELYASEVVAPMAAFLTARFGPGQHYEVGNEPTSCTFWGTTDQYLAMYAAAVQGILSVDPTAQVGGPSHSTDVRYSGTLADAGGETIPFLQRFLRFGAEHPSGRLPIDFLTLHSYEVNPASNAHYHEDQLVLVRRWLGESGYPTTTPIVHGEWYYRPWMNFADEDVNLSWVGAAYLGATFLALDAAGYANQSSQSYMDLGEGALGVASPMFATIRGIPRAGYFVFDWLSSVSGPSVHARPDHPWVRSVAAEQANETTLFLASFVPTETMSLQRAGGALVDDSPELVAALAPHASALRAYLLGTDPTLPAAIRADLSVAQQAVVVAAKAEFDAERARRADWAVGPERDAPLTNPGRPLVWRVVVGPLDRPMQRVLLESIDSKHDVNQAKARSLFLELFTNTLPIACASADTIKADLGSTKVCSGLDAFCASGGADQSGLGLDSGCLVLETYVVELATRATYTRTRALLEAGHASPTVMHTFDTRFAEAFLAQRGDYDALYTRDDVRPRAVDLTSTARMVGNRLVLEIPAEPFSVHRLRVQY